MKKTLIFAMLGILLMISACVSSPPNSGEKEPPIPPEVDIPSDNSAESNPENIENIVLADSQPEDFTGIIDFNQSVTLVIKNDGSLWTGLRNQFDTSDKPIPLGRAGDNAEGFEKILPDVTKASLTGEEDIWGDAGYAVTGNGELWGWGNLSYAIGSGDEVWAETPVKILSNIKDFAFCGGYCYAMTAGGELWVWGEHIGSGWPILKEPTRMAENVSRLIVNEAQGERDVWFVQDKSAYRLAHTTTGTPTAYGELVMDNAIQYWGTVILTTDGQVIDIGTMPETKIIDDAIQISDRSLQEYLAVRKNGELVSWEHSYTALLDNERNMTPQVIADNCRYVIGGIYRYIDFDGRLWQLGDEESILIDEDVCYGLDAYYIKKDGSLWLKSGPWTDGTWEHEKLFDDVLMP